MTVDDLIAEARLNRTGPSSSGDLSPSNLSEFLRLALGYLLEDLDYEADKTSGGAVAARVLAALITDADAQLPLIRRGWVCIEYRGTRTKKPEARRRESAGGFSLSEPTKGK